MSPASTFDPVGVAAFRRELHARPIRARAARRGLVLLEVVVSLGVLLVAIAVVGVVFHNGQENVVRAEKLMRGMIMSERLIAEIDTNSGLLDVEQREQSGFFRDEETLAGMSWKVTANPSQRVEGLLEIDVEIFIGDPDGEPEMREYVMGTRIFRALPRGIDLENDFGLDEEQVTQITDQIPGGAQLIDPRNFDPRMLASLDMDTLIEMLPTLIAAFGQNFAGGQLDQIIAAIQSGDTSALQQIAGQRGGMGFPGGMGGGGRQGGGQQGGAQQGGGQQDSGQQGGQQGGGQQNPGGRRGAGARGGGGR